MKSTPILAGIVAILGLLLVGIGCGAAATPTPTPAPKPATLAPTPAPKEVVFGSVTSYTGALAVMGQIHFPGLKMAADEINEAGGFKVGDQTYRIKLLTGDAESKPERAVAILNKQLDEDKPVVVFPENASLTAGPMAEVGIQRGNVIMFSAAVAFQGKIRAGGLLFSSAPAYDWLAPDFLDYARGKLGIKSVALLFPDNDTGRYMVDVEYSPALKRRGLDIVSSLYYAEDVKDFYPFLTKIKAAKPDALLLGYNEPPVQMAIGQALELGVTKNFLSRGPSLNVALPNKDQIDNFFWLLYTPLDKTDDAKVLAWKERYQKRFGRAPDEAHNDAWALYFNYDLANNAVEAMKRAGTVTDVKAIADALRKLTFSGISGQITYDEKGQSVRSVTGGHMVKGGNFSYFPIVPKKE